MPNSITDCSSLLPHSIVVFSSDLVDFTAVIVAITIAIVIVTAAGIVVVNSRVLLAPAVTNITRIS